MNESEMAKIIKTVTEYEIQIIKLKDEKTNAIAKIEEELEYQENRHAETQLELHFGQILAYKKALRILKGE